MKNSKPSLYEILGVASSSTPQELKAAHRRRSLEIMSGKLGLSREECDYQLKVLDVTLNTLIDPGTRNIYDLQLAEAERGPCPGPAPLSLVATPQGGQRALQVADAIVGASRQQLNASPLRRIDFQGVSEPLAASGRALKIILRLIILTVFLFVAIRIGHNSLAQRTGVSQPPPHVVARAEEKLAIQDYFRRTGVRVGSAAEARALDEERRVAEVAARTEEFEKRKEREQIERLVAEAERDSAAAAREFERASAEASYEAQRRERQAHASRGQEE